MSSYGSRNATTHTKQLAAAKGRGYAAAPRWRVASTDSGPGAPEGRWRHLPETHRSYAAAYAAAAAAAVHAHNQPTQIGTADAGRVLVADTDTGRRWFRLEPWVTPTTVTLWDDTRILTIVCPHCTARHSHGWPYPRDGDRDAHPGVYLAHCAGGPLHSSYWVGRPRRRTVITDERTTPAPLNRSGATT